MSTAHVLWVVAEGLGNAFFWRSYVMFRMFFSTQYHHGDDKGCKLELRKG